MVEAGCCHVACRPLPAPPPTAPQDCLRFQLCEGRLDLLESDYVKRLNPSFLDTLSTFNSVPVFLAQVTQELFSGVTRSV